MDERIEAEAFAWHDRLRDDPSPACRQAFEAWRAADPRHAEAFAQQATLAAAARLRGHRGVMPEVGQRSGQWRSFGIAAAGAAVAALLAIVSHPADWPAAVVPQATMPAVLTRAVRLPDGSLAVLDTVARLEGARPRQARLLSGAARFFVVHDPMHPFQVAADGVRVTARGTIFDVALAAHGVRVALLDGRVEVERQRTGGARPPVIALAPGEALAPEAAAPERAAVPVPITWLDVDGMALGDILTLARRSGGTSIELADPALAVLQVTGRFDLSRPDKLAAKLAAALDLRVARRGDVLRLERPK